MLKMNLIGDYEGEYKISLLEWLLGFVNLVLLVGLALYIALGSKR
jgi:hypothetical protein